MVNLNDVLIQIAANIPLCFYVLFAKKESYNKKNKLFKNNSLKKSKKY